MGKSCAKREADEEFTEYFVWNVWNSSLLRMWNIMWAFVNKKVGFWTSQDRQWTHIVTLRRVRAAFVAVGKQMIYIECVPVALLSSL
jgi:hypothetical protein